MVLVLEQFGFVVSPAWWWCLAGSGCIVVVSPAMPG